MNNQNQHKKEYQKKVLMLSPPPESTGGIARWTSHVLEYFNNLDESMKLSFDFLYFPMERKKFITAATSLTFKIKEGIIDYITILNKYCKILSNENPSVVHLVSSAFLGLIKDIIIEMINQKRGIKTVVHFRFGRIPELAKVRNWEWKLLKLAIKNANKVIVIDITSYNTLIENNFSNIEYIPNPIAPKILSLIKNFDSLQRNERKIVFAGHMLPTKGVFELLRACVQIRNIRLVMMGKLIPGIKEKLLEIAKRKDDKDWIDIVGEQDFEVVIKEMLSCAVFVLPSYTEGFPNVILESMACGCSIVSTPVGAIPEMLNISNPSIACGTCVDVKNVDSLKEAIERYLNNRELAEEHGANAKKRVSSEYNISGVWKKLVHIWEETNESVIV